MKSIRRALLFSLLAGLAAIALVASAATYVAARHEIGELLDLQLKQLANSTRIDELLRGHQPSFDPRATPNAEGVTELVTQIWDRDGVLVYWSRPGTGAIYGTVVSNVHPGSIVIQHDGGGDRSETLAALPQEIDTLRHEGYKFVTVTQLLGYRLIYK